MQSLLHFASEETESQRGELICLKLSTGGPNSKESACNAEDPGLIPGSERSPGEGNQGLTSPFLHQQADSLPLSHEGARWTLYGVLGPLNLASLMVQMVKESACSTGDPGSIPGLGRSPGEGNGAHSNILAWRTPQTGEPGRLPSTGSERVGHNWVTDTSTLILSTAHTAVTVQLHSVKKL